MSKPFNVSDHSRFPVLKKRRSLPPGRQRRRRCAGFFGYISCSSVISLLQFFAKWNYRFLRSGILIFCALTWQFFAQWIKFNLSTYDIFF